MVIPPGYRDVELVGTGATSRVFRAIEARTGLPVALKRLHRRLVANDEALARLRRELEALRLLRHPGLVAVRDVIRWQGDPTIVMDFVDGVDLKQRLEAGPLPFDEVERIARALIDLLVATHGAGVVHRDIKPQNVRLGADGQVYLLDFGSARLDATSELTVTGTSVGTPDYMAPELFAGSVYDPRADVYGLGATLYEAIAGRVPQVASSLSELAFKRNREAVAPVRTHRIDTPAALAQVVDRALARRPEDRFASMALLRWALDHPQAELAFQDRRGRQPQCLHCEHPVAVDAAVCPNCGSDHPFGFATGHSHVTLKHVLEPSRFAAAFVDRFPDWTTPSARVALAERLAALEDEPQRLVSFVKADEARALARALERDGTATCEVEDDAGISGWRRLGWGLSTFLVGVAVVAYVSDVGLSLMQLFALALPAVLALFAERVSALSSAEQGILTVGRYPAAIRPGQRGTLGLAALSAVAAGAALPAFGAALPAWFGVSLGVLQAGLLALGAGLGGGALVAWIARFRRPRVVGAPAPRRRARIGAALSVPVAAGLTRLRTEVAVLLTLTVVALVPVELAGLMTLNGWWSATAAPVAAQQGPIAPSVSLSSDAPQPGPTSRVPAVEPPPTAAVPSPPMVAPPAPTPAPDTWPIFGWVLALLVAALAAREPLLRWFRIRAKGDAMATDWSTKQLTDRSAPARTPSPSAADAIAMTKTDDPFVKAARARAADLARIVSPDDAERLMTAVHRLAEGGEPAADQQRSALARSIVESDPELRLRFEFLALEGQLEAEASQRWWAQIEGDP